MFFKNNNNIKLFTKHSYHFIDPSPWPLLISSGVFMLTVSLVTWMPSFKGGYKHCAHKRLILNDIH
jgi:hypothetical protein